MLSSQSKTPNLVMTVYPALFIALIIVGSYISVPIPIGPVPIALADFFVMLTGFFLGGKYGLLSVVLYLGLGVIGLPVFSNGGSGLAFLLGPTGGFLIGYVLLAATIGFLTDRERSTFLLDVVAVLLGNILLYGVGITWLKMTLELSWSAAFAAGFLPFLPGTIVKIIVVLIISRRVVPGFKEKMR